MELTNEFTVDVPVEQAWAVLTDLQRIAPCMPGAQLQEIDGDDYKGVVRVKVGPVTAEYRGKAQFLERDAAAHKAVLRAEGRETRGQGNASATITAQLAPSGAATRVSVMTDLSISGRVAQFGRGVLADVSNKLLGQFVEQLEATVLSEGSEAAGGSEGDRDGAGGTGAGGTGAGGTGAGGTGAGGTGAGGTGAGGPEEPQATPATAPTSGASAIATTAARGTETQAEPTADGHRSAADWTASSAGPEPAPVNLLRVVGPVILKRLAPPVVLGVLFVLWRRRRRRRRTG